MSDFNSRVSSLQAEKGRIEAAIRSLGVQINTVVPDCTEKTVLALENAMMRIYKLAIFIRGDFDKRPLDEEQQSNLSAQAVEGFVMARKLAEGGTVTLSAHHSSLSNENGNLTVLGTKVSTLFQDAQSKLSSLRSEIFTLRGQEATLRANIQLQESSLGDLERKKRSQETANDVVGVAVDLFTMGPFGLLISRVADTPRPSQVVNLDGMIKDTQKSINSARDLLKTTQANMNKCNNSILDCEYQQSQLQVIQQMIPGIQQILQKSTSDCNALIQQLLPLKKACIELERQVGTVKQRATIVAGQSVGKVEWTSGILDICSAVIFTYRLADEVQLIAGELEREWGTAKPLPNELSKTINSLKTKTDALLQNQNQRMIAV
ncbi:hypothetical protein TWF173_007921 [Orbilia oligospora]|uniref:Uncharacterized protein n=2 Tax=Orbilia oligospora TaxID=2813651 RepID=G1X142_ARTOA|nr:hypothetical protein AOL_s00007g1 [Orbilia oligospora ATCC 24927]EGX53052.1 hypothetical protein AOL_s00007g1 [Orbilia oligospora ATCC 24927]KAF3287457.1 hypothetical protein TWF970_007182 [Orbilia oligospora]KAF3311829.1 hypothetical protein TWF173_007921 [Orbilia oligospora]